jgi:hypothetical protein
VSEIEVLPRELLAAAAPLRRAAEALEDVADHRRSLADLIGASPSARLVDAFRSFLASWELVVWSAGEDAGGFADRVELAGAYYAARESAIARGVPDVTPWGDMPALRETAAPVLVPHPAPAPSPAPATAPAPSPVPSP